MGEPAEAASRKRGRPAKPETAVEKAPKRKAAEGEAAAPAAKKGRGRPKSRKAKPQKLTKPKGGRTASPSKSDPAEDAE